MSYRWLAKPKWLILLPLVAILIVAVACGDDATPAPSVIEREVVKEVPVEVVREVIKEVEVPKEVIKEIEVPREVVKEIEVQVPVTVVAVATPTTAAPVAMSKVTRLKFATPAPWVELTLPWYGDTWGNNFATRNHLEPLIEIHYKTGEMVPLLATSWSMDTPDAKTWTFKLRKGVPFSYGWGEFTSEDIPHIINQIAAEGAIPHDASLFRDYLGDTDQERNSNIERVDAYTVTFHLKVPEPDFDAIMSSKRNNILIHSARQWDESGEAESRLHPAGTGPWKFIKHTPGFSLLWEAKEEHHKKVPAFKEFEMVLSPEPATRMAMVLTGEAHMAELPRELHAQMIAQGMKVESSEGPATQIFYLMAGSYLPETDAYDPDGVFASVKIREAVNRAINREQVIRELFKGVGEPQRVMAGHPELYGWSDRFDAEWEAKYGYDPERARALVKEAGFEGARVEIFSFILAGLTESPQMSEALQIELKAIGLDPKIVSVEWARLFATTRAREAHGKIWPQKTDFASNIAVVRGYNTGPPAGTTSSFEAPFIQENYEKLLHSSSKEERDQLMRQILGYKFDNYGEVPLLWVPSQVIVDPKVIADYTWPGIIDAGFDHFEYIVPAG